MKCIPVSKCVLALIVSLLITDVRAGNYCVLNKRKCDDLSLAIQGKWGATEWGNSGHVGGRSKSPESAHIVKVYVGYDFYYFFYHKRGKVYQSYGGTYEVSGENKIIETIAFYSPYQIREIHPGANGQGAIVSSNSMVGAQGEMTIEFDGSTMVQEGIVTQVTPEDEDPRLFGPIAVNIAFKKANNNTN